MNNHDELQEENKRLKAEIERRDNSLKNKRKRQLWIVKKVGTFFIGVNLKQSILNSINEFNEKKSISKDNVSDLAANIIWRITRISLVAIIIASYPTVLFFQQNELIGKQNKLFENQNTRIEQQTHLIEADRRSAQVFIMGEVLSDVNRELEDKQNVKKKLSDGLVGRIISLSKAMKPYRFLEGDSLISKPLSPERGQLLIALLESDIDQSFLSNKIFQKADFSFTDLRNSTIQNKNLNKINLSNSDFSGSLFMKTSFKRAHFMRVNFSNSQLNNISVEGTSFNDANFSKAKISNFIFAKKELNESGYNFLKMTNLKNVNFDSTRVGEIKLQDKIVNKKHNWFRFGYSKDSLHIDGVKELNEVYTVDSTHFVTNIYSIEGFVSNLDSINKQALEKTSGIIEHWTYTFVKKN